MKKRGAVLLGLVVLAGCGDEGLTRIAGPQGPSFNGGGVGFGSGHVTPRDTTRATTTNATTQEDGGGVMFGSGH
jgi:hypothetical protein